MGAPGRCQESATTVSPVDIPGVRYIVVPVAVFSLEAPWAPHVAGADASVEAAVVIDLPVCLVVDDKSFWTLDRSIGILTRQRGKPAFRSQVEGTWRIGPKKRLAHDLGICLSAPERHGKRYAGA